MTLVLVVGGCVLIGAVVLSVVGVLAEVRRVRMERADAIRQIRMIDTALHSNTKLVKELKDLARMTAIAGLVMGAKCKGCGKTVKRDDLEPCGEDSKGRPVELCMECRVLMGMGTGEKKEDK